MTEQYFEYNQEAIDYLRAKDKRMAAVIDRIGVVKRRVIPDLFAALVHSIVGQQISTKAHETIWQKVVEKVGEVTPKNIAALTDEELQSVGLSFRKVAYIKTIAQQVLSGEFDVAALHDMTDEEVCQRLSQLRGIGVWSAEMLMLFSMQRPDILSFGDLAIVRGLRMIHHHRKIDRPLFEKYRRRYSPYCSVASLYIWAVAGGAIPELKDLAPKPKRK
ncbi:MAG: DNA-3-methyladenine glycosylase 2 family protein [Bacteroidales bacterium]|nr:DNA-3-methyladenine glycosylase 2 family protein [Bacteroidales bacterium]